MARPPTPGKFPLRRGTEFMPGEPFPPSRCGCANPFDSEDNPAIFGTRNIHPV
jgi:hypothetical protein